MGIDAKAILKGNPSPIDVMCYLDSLGHVTKASIKPTSVDDFVWIDFCWHGEQRHMSAFFNGNCKCDYENVYPHDACYVSIGAWGMSDAIITSLMKKFGGFYQLNDCTDEWTSYNN